MEASVVRKLLGVIVGVSILVPLVLLMFITPASKGAPHDLPIGVVGPQAVADRVAGVLDERQPGAFAVTAFDDLAALEDAARDREVYGGFVPGPQPKTVVASGAGPAVATLLTGIGAQVAAAQGPPGPAPAVIDVAPPSDGDPRGTGFGAMVMPVFMAGMVLGLASAILGGRRRVMAAVLVTGAVAVSAAATGVAALVGVLDGVFWREWLALGAGILAISVVVAGLFRLLGGPGVGIAALCFLLIGMPLAGMAAPPEFLPAGWAGLGQWLPLGATGTALRSASFFDGAGSSLAFTALAVWIVIGVVLLAVPRRPAQADVSPAARRTRAQWITWGPGL